MGGVWLCAAASPKAQAEIGGSCESDHEAQCLGQSADARRGGTGARWFTTSSLQASCSRYAASWLAAVCDTTGNNNGEWAKVGERMRRGRGDGAWMSSA